LEQLELLQRIVADDLPFVNSQSNAAIRTRNMGPPEQRNRKLDPTPNRLTDPARRSIFVIESAMNEILEQICSCSSAARRVSGGSTGPQQETRIVSGENRESGSSGIISSLPMEV